MIKKLVLSLLLSTALLHNVAYALRCGNRLITVGDHYTKVLQLCRQPDYVKEWVEERIYRSYGDPFDDLYDHGRVESGKIYGPGFVKRPVVIEEWTYNFGRHRFMQLLRFEDGWLKKIDSLEYGY